MEVNKALTPFEFEGETVRTAGSYERPLFCAADVARILGYIRPESAYKRLDQDECEFVMVRGVSTDKRLKRQLYVTESGLYSLILWSEKEEAIRFKRWIVREVLPSIRKKGYYSAVEAEREAQNERLLELCFPSLPGPAKPIFRPLIEAMNNLRKERKPSGNPVWARSLARRVYSWSIPIDGEQAKRRALNPDPGKQSTDHSMFSDGVNASVREVVQVAIAVAKLSINYSEWSARMDLIYKNRPMQLQLMVPLGDV